MTRPAILATSIFVACVGVAAYSAVNLFRYEPMTARYPNATADNRLFVQVWDRWNARACVTVRPEISDVTGTACNETEVRALLERIREAKLSLQERERERLVTIAGEGPGGAAAIVRLRRAGVSEAEIGAWATDHRARMVAAGAPNNLLDAYWGGHPYLPPR
jgi:hypothetical protein